MLPRVVRPDSEIQLRLEPAAVDRLAVARLQSDVSLELELVALPVVIEADVRDILRSTAHQVVEPGLVEANDGLHSLVQNEQSETHHHDRRLDRIRSAV